MKHIKLLSLFLAMLMVLTAFVGCGEKEDSNSSKNDESTPDSSIVSDNKDDDSADSKDESTNDSASLDNSSAGETDGSSNTLSFNGENLHVVFTYPDSNETKSMIIALKQVTDDLYTIYIGDGIVPLNEVVFEVSDTETKKYVKNVLDGDYTLDTSLTSADLEKEVDNALEMISWFMMNSPMYQGVEFKKVEDTKSILLGTDCYAFEMTANGEAKGKVVVDKATNIVVECYDQDGTEVFKVMTLKTEFDMPEYK